MLRKNIVLSFLMSTACYMSLLAAEVEDTIQENEIIIFNKRIILDEFPHAFNPSIIKVDQGFLMTFRYFSDRWHQPWIAYVGIVLLNDALEPISQPELLNTRPKVSKTPSQAEDARIFAYRDRLFIIYNDNVDKTDPYYTDRRDMFIAELLYEDNHYIISAPLKLVYTAKYEHQVWQKNWVPFEWNKTLLLTYTLSPHEVICPDLKSGACYHFDQTNPALNWNFGTMRGSTPPILVDGEYLAFFHSSIITSSAHTYGVNLWHYFMAAYTFSPEPPFEITKITPLPILTEGFYTPPDLGITIYDKRVVFPGGLVECGNNLYLSYGKNDCEMWIAILDKEALKKALVHVGS